MLKKEFMGRGARYLNSLAAGIDQVCTDKHALSVTVETFKFIPASRRRMN